MRSLALLLLFVGLLAPLRADPPALKCSDQVQFQSQARPKLFKDILCSAPGVGTLDTVFFPTASAREVVKIEIIVMFHGETPGEEVWTVSHPDGQLAYYRVRMKTIVKDLAERGPADLGLNNYAISVQRLKRWPVPPAAPKG